MKYRGCEIKKSIFEFIGYDKFIKNPNRFEFHKILYCYLVNEEFIDIYNHFMQPSDWNYLVINYNLSEEFIFKYKDILNWNCISKEQELSEQFIEKMKDLVNWNYIFCHQYLSIEFCNKYLEKINWRMGTDFWSSNSSVMRESIFEKCIDKIYLYDLLGWRIVSCGFLEKYKDRYTDGDWRLISSYQNLSKEFIANNFDNLDVNFMLQNRNIDKEIKDYIRMLV